MSPFGLLEFLVIAFPGDELSEQVEYAVRKVGVNGDLRIIDAQVVVKDTTGEVRSQELAHIAALADDAVVPGRTLAPLGLIDAEDVTAIGTVLPLGSVAVALLLEHVWARETARTAHASGWAWLASIAVPDH
ncbi:MAG: hypothetical protein AUI14_06125 [Actinobacteria bacterium 13_2_20CM_2_71_6]|nr:MAG: hypothetical protein AUI14_06125 [Actinobacteria bacterium 13_2_20CM_2_71_6]